MQKEKTKTTEDTNNELVSLKEFIDEHQKIIAVFGVFVALGLFWKNLEIKEFASYPSMICFLIGILILFEIWRHIDTTKSSWSVLIFANLLNIITFRIIFFVFVFFPDNRKYLISSTLTFGILISVWIFLEKKINSFVENEKLKDKEALNDLTDYLSYIKNEDIPLKTQLENQTSQYISIFKRYAILTVFYKPIFVFLLLLILSIFSELITPFIDTYLETVYKQYLNQ